MGSARLVGVTCTDCETRYAEGVIDPPCPTCGSVRRTFLQHNSAELKPEGTLEWLRRGEQKQVLGYGDTGRHGTVRHGNLEPDNTVSLLIEGRPPRNEEDTGRVLATLAAAMSSADDHFGASVSGDGADIIYSYYGSDSIELGGIDVIIGQTSTDTVVHV